MTDKSAPNSRERQSAAPSDDSPEFYEGTLMDGLENEPPYPSAASSDDSPEFYEGTLMDGLENEPPYPPAALSLDDKLAVMAHKMTDAELRAAIERIRGNPKKAGSRARRLNPGESLALLALMAEEARRVKA